MKIIFWLVFICGCIYSILFLIRFTLLRFKFKFNPADMWMFFGLPGSGKSTVCAEIIRQIYLSSFKLKSALHGIAVYCNFPVRHSFKISRDDIGVIDFRTDSCDRALLCIDECSTVYMKRDAMTRKKDGSLKFGEEENKFHSMHRHYKTMEVLFAQSWDGVDLRMRELSTGLFYVEPSRIRPFIKIRKISKIFAINDEHQPIDGYDFEKWSSRYVYAPHAWKLFDTYDAPSLPQVRPSEWYDESETIEDAEPKGIFRHALASLFPLRKK